MRLTTHLGLEIAIETRSQINIRLVHTMDFNK